MRLTFLEGEITQEQKCCTEEGSRAWTFAVHQHAYWNSRGIHADVTRGTLSFSEFVRKVGGR